MDTDRINMCYKGECLVFHTSGGYSKGGGYLKDGVPNKGSNLNARPRGKWVGGWVGDRAFIEAMQSLTIWKTLNWKTQEQQINKYTTITNSYTAQEIRTGIQGTNHTIETENPLSQLLNFRGPWNCMANGIVFSACFS